MSLSGFSLSFGLDLELSDEVDDGCGSLRDGGTRPTGFSLGLLGRGRRSGDLRTDLLSRDRDLRDTDLLSMGGRPPLRNYL